MGDHYKWFQIYEMIYEINEIQFLNGSNLQHIPYDTNNNLYHI